MSPPPDALESGPGDLSFVGMTHPQARLGLRQLAGVEQTLQTGGLGDEPAFHEVLDLPVARGRGIIRPAFGDRRYLETLPTRPFMVDIGIVEVERSVTLTYPSKKPTGMPFLEGKKEKRPPTGPKEISVSVPTLVINLALVEEDPRKRIGMFRVFFTEGGERSDSPSEKEFRGKGLDSAGVEIDLRTGKGKIVGRQKGRPDGEVITAARFNVSDMGSPLTQTRARLQPGEKPDADSRPSYVTEVDEGARTSRLAMDFVVGVVAAARNHLAQKDQPVPLPTPKAEPAKIAS